jgi:uncharacterized Zn-finger protein
MSGARQDRVVQVTEHDLPLHCPTPSMQLWNQHPRVFLNVAEEGEVQCPYCGMRYVYVGAKPKGH